MAIPRKRTVETEDFGRKRPPIIRADEGDDKKGSNDGIFKGVNVLFLDGGVSSKRLQIWKEKVQKLGGTVFGPGAKVGKNLTHILASDYKFYQDSEVHGKKRAKKAYILRYAWIEDSLKDGKLLDHDPYILEDPVASSCSSNRRLSEISTVTNNYLEESETKIPFVEMNIQEGGNNAEKLNSAENKASLAKTEVCTDFVPHNVHQMEFNEDEKLERTCSDEETDIETCDEDANKSSGLNEHITSILREMWDIYESVLGDEWRSLTYRKAVIQLEKLQCRISSLEDVKRLPGIGSSMVDKIKEILSTGRLQKLENLKADPKQVLTLQQLASVWGVGPKLAQKLYQAGHRTVEDLRNEPSLSRMAQIGVKYHKDLMLRIPREEVEVAEKYVQNVAADLCPGIIINVAGSYRRGKQTCGDIDFLATHPDGYSHRGFLVKLVEKLRSIGFIIDGIHCSDHSSEDYRKVDTFMGVGQIPKHNHFRRIDIKVYPKESYAFALVYFTGNDILNRKIRYAAQRKGYKLNDQGLFTRFGGKKGISSTVCIPCDTEEDVFNKVGVPYLEPYDRNI